jgi:hypothetical protein
MRSAASSIQNTGTPGNDVRSRNQDGGFGRPKRCGVRRFREQYDPTSIHNHDGHKHAQFRCPGKSAVA